MLVHLAVAPFFSLLATQLKKWCVCVCCVPHAWGGGGGKNGLHLWRRRPFFNFIYFPVAADFRIFELFGIVFCVLIDPEGGD